MVSMHTSPNEQPGSVDSGGMNVAILETALALAARGIEVDLLTRAVKSPAVTHLAPGVTLHELACGGRGRLPKSQLTELTDDFGEAVANLTGRVRSRYDLIHAHYWLSGLASLPVALELSLPFVQSFHTIAAMKNQTLAPGQAPEGEQRTRTEMFLANQASAIVAASAAEVSSLIDDLRAPPERIWVIPPGADIALFHPSRADDAGRRIRNLLGIDPDRPVITIAGRVQPLKGQDLAIRVLAKMHEGAVRPVFVIAGEATPGDEKYAASLRATATQFGVHDSLRFTGPLPRQRLADLFAASALTLVPSLSETFGLVAIESAASGTPVIAFRGGGLIDSVADGSSGILIDSRDATVWATTICSLLADPARLEQLGVSARQHAERFTWPATATALIGLYSSLVR